MWKNLFLHSSIHLPLVTWSRAVISRCGGKSNGSTAQIVPDGTAAMLTDGTIIAVTTIVIAFEVLLGAKHMQRLKS